MSKLAEAVADALYVLFIVAGLCFALWLYSEHVAAVRIDRQQFRLRAIEACADRGDTSAVTKCVRDLHDAIYPKEDKK